MPAKRIAFDAEARAGLQEGAAMLSKAVKTTLGPRGRNVILSKSWGAPSVTKDGVSVAKEIELPDHYQNMGAQLLKAAASKTNDDAGDGTTTAVTLAHQMLVEGMKAVAAGSDPMSLKRGIDQACAAAVSDLAERSRPVEGRNEYERIALVSSNHDAETAKTIADALDLVGHEGVVTIDEGKSAEIVSNVVEGMQFDRGFLSARFANSEDGNECVLENPYILLHQSKLSSAQDLLPLLQNTAKVGRPLLIIAEDVEGEALSTLVVNQLRGVISACAVKAPAFGDRRKAILGDIAVMTRGQVIAEELGIRLERVVLGMLGEAESVRIDKDNTTIVRGKGGADKIEERKRQIRLEIENSSSEYDREKLQERLAKLSGGITVIEVGAPTEVEMKERKQRVEDALSATRAAIEEGIIPGGGVALLRAQAAVDALIESGAGDNDDERIGMAILQKSLSAPLIQLASNAGVEASVVAANILSSDNPNDGYDVAALEYVDMIEAGIIDPTKVARTALQNAASVAGTVLTTEAAIAEAPED